VRSTVGFELPSHEALAQLGVAAADVSTEKAGPDRAVVGDRAATTAGGIH
jgi:hypothetical protein